MEQVKEVVDNVHSMGGYAAPLREVAINLVIGYELQDLCMCEQVYVCVCMEMWYLTHTHTHTPRTKIYYFQLCKKPKRKNMHACGLRIHRAVVVSEAGEQACGRNLSLHSFLNL